MEDGFQVSIYILSTECANMQTKEIITDQSAAKLQEYLLLQRRLKWAKLHLRQQPLTFPLRWGIASAALLLLLWITKLIILDPILLPF